MIPRQSQLTLPEPSDHRVTPDDKPRLRGQNAKILERLKQGPATNTELSKISLKYTSRISDLRSASYTITCTRLQGGVTQYKLG